MKKIIYLLCLAWLMACSIQAKKEEFFYFQFNNEDLTDIVHHLAAKRDVNIVFPLKAPLNARVTMFINEPFTLDQAWEKLHMLLDLAGYLLIDKDSQCTIVKNEATSIKEALPIYLGVAPDKIPDSDERIRYVYYLTNLRIGDKFNDTDLAKILNDMLPKESILTDPITNGLIISDKANNIKSVMNVVTQLDSADFKEHFSIIQLHNTDPQFVAKLFDELLKTSKQQQQYTFDPKKPLTESSYFPKNAHVFPIPRTNSLLILGTQVAIDRIKDFLTKYIDVELESGKSILHIYKLQYMDANNIKNVLNDVLKIGSKGTGQSTEGGKSPINPTTQERMFDKIIIETDVPAAGKEAAYYGNNNLIIACRNDDWVRIKSLIEQLDQVQPQVIIEVLIANLTLNEAKNLGAISANPAELNFPKGVNIQSAQIGPGIIINPVEGSPAKAVLTSSLAGDLMADVPNGTLTPPDPVTSYLTPGSTVLAINNGTGGANGTAGNTWSILQMLDVFSYTKVIANPHLIATHNTNAHVEIGQTRLINDQTVGSGGGTTVVKLKDIKATYKVDITPLIFTGEVPGGKDDSVNLSVIVDIEDFIPGANTNNARLNRRVETKAVLKNGQILALGGLIDHEIDDNFNGTPILSKIPILGWLTKFRSKTRTDTNLTIFIAPTIIEPRLRGGLSQYTKDYVDLTKTYSKEAELFESLQDPVTRFFFKKKHNPRHEIQDFVNQDEFKREVSTSQYKSVIDVDQATSIQEKNQPSAPAKKNKRIVLSNLNDKGNKDSQSNAQVPSNDVTPSQKVCNEHNPLTENMKTQQENIKLAKTDVKKLDRNLLKEQLQKILEAEDNPLL